MSYTSDQIKEKLQTSQQWLERGVVAIWERQTSYEQQVDTTLVRNDVGFNSPDAGYLSYVANWVRSGRHLSGSHVKKTRDKMLKYSGQLAKIANGEI